MSDMVGNPEILFSHVAAHVTWPILSNSRWKRNAKTGFSCEMVLRSKIFRCSNIVHYVRYLACLYYV